MALMCEECKCSTYYNEETDMYSCENDCLCCNDPDYISTEEQYDRLVQYIKLHHLSLNQDEDKISAELDAIEDLNSDEYKFKEIEHISIMGQIIGVGHILKVIGDGWDNV